MLITNGKKLVVPNNDIARLEELAKTLKGRAKDVLGVAKAKFTLQEEPFPHLINENEFTFAELKQMCLPDIDLQFRAIGNERVQMPDKKMKDIRHTFTPEEKAQIADQFCDLQSDKEKLEEEKKSINKQYSQKIEAMESELSELAKKHRQGYELKTLETHLHLDFEGKERIYTDINTGEVLHSEPLEPNDYQMKIEFGGKGFTREDGGEIEPDSKSEEVADFTEA